jgi:hypothetical protein
MPKFKLDLLEDVEIDDIDTSDYPDIYGFITSAYYKGKQMTDDQIDKLNDQVIYDTTTADWFYDKIWWTIH